MNPLKNKALSQDGTRLCRTVSAQVHTRALAAAVTLLWSANVLAAVQVSVSATDPAVTPPTTSVTGADATSISRSITNGGSSATASVDLSTGVLRSFSRAAGPTSQFTDTRAIGTSFLTDTFSFNAGASGTAFLDWGFDGTLLTNPNKFGVNAFSAGTLTISLFQLNGGLPISVQSQLTNNSVCDAGTDNCVFGDAAALRGSIAVPVIPAGYRIDVTLLAGALWGDTASFQNTSYLYLRLPDGVSITSGSGAFLTTASPIPAVPDAPTWASLLAGLIFVRLLKRRLV